ncbi:MAG: nicotinate (nicotinamide) nucleotide adenylyltransferase [Clostridia bacterium]|nr:nicotinate (nicotinamide) nucleotide adenylyltransferase [Clostridia bacterium]
MDEITRIGIYCGTFAPIHNGHVNAAKAFMDQMQLHYLFVIPTALDPSKIRDEGDEARHRMKMCELAFEGEAGVVIIDMEIEKGGISYTVDTLRALAREDRRLFMLVGTDMALKLDSWREPEEIFKLCYPTYVRRESDKLLENQIIEKNTKYLNDYGKICRRIMTPEIELSSTEIREMVKRGEDISDLVPEKVAEYIKENKLYL